MPGWPYSCARVCRGVCSKRPTSRNPHRAWAAANSHQLVHRASHSFPEQLWQRDDHALGISTWRERCSFSDQPRITRRFGVWRFLPTLSTSPRTEILNNLRRRYPQPARGDQVLQRITHRLEQGDFPGSPRRPAPLSKSRSSVDIASRPMAPSAIAATGRRPLPARLRGIHHDPRAPPPGRRSRAWTAGRRRPGRDGRPASAMRRAPALRGRW